MSNSLVSLRHKINAAERLGSVVRAMKAVAAASISQYEAAVAALGHYRETVELGLALCLREETAAAPATTPARGRPVGVLVFGSDQGLVGRFNQVIGDFTLEALREYSGPKILWVVGERARGYFEGTGLTVQRQFAVPNSVAAITALVTDLQMEIEHYTAQEARAEIQVFHNRPRSAASYEPTTQRLLPLDALWRSRMTALAWPGRSQAEVLGGGAASLAALIHEHLFISLYQSCAESLASENASRLEAMQRAEKNIQNVSDELRRALNRLRQSSIDEELFDVVEGFDEL